MPLITDLAEPRETVAGFGVVTGTKQTTAYPWHKRVAGSRAAGHGVAGTRVGLRENLLSNNNN